MDGRLINMVVRGWDGYVELCGFYGDVPVCPCVFVAQALKGVSLSHKDRTMIARVSEGIILEGRSWERAKWLGMRCQF